MIHVATCTCNIAAKYPSNGLTYGYATAFFVGPTLLLTAAHIYDGADTEIVAQLPGRQTTHVDIKQLFLEKPPIQVFKCSALLLNRPVAADILVLDCSSSGYRAHSWIDISRNYLVDGVGIDLVGYPGPYSPQYVADTQNMPEVSATDIDDLRDLLPACQLTISYGTVMKEFRAPILRSYRVSTIGGMSGSPVVLGGKAVGIV